jgi:hypothetical protein
MAGRDAGLGKERKPVRERQPRHSQAGGVQALATLCRPIVLAIICAALSGCANFWDEVTSRDFKFKEAFHRAPEPLWVIQNSYDGDKKSKALRSLKEPLQNGGTPDQQEVIVKLLINSAVADPQPLCRLAAIDALQHFKDPRAAKALENAYYNAKDFSNRNPDISATIQGQALSAMGEMGNPASVDLLITIVKEPPAAGADTDRQRIMDQRIYAARALGHFQQYQAAEALVSVLRTDQDVALRNRATESLRAMTGEDLPPDAQAWADYLHKSDGKGAFAKKPSFTDKFLKLISFP